MTDRGDPYRTPATPTRPCPRCATGLGTRHVLEVVMDECATCEGVFVPGDLVLRLLDPLDLGPEVMSSFAPGMPEPETAVRYLRCPRCRDIMGRHLIVRGSNVIVDRCARHGVWFDAHELRRLAELTAHHHAEVRYPPEPPAPADDLLDLQTRRAVAAALVRPIGAHDRGTLLATLFEVLLRRRGG